LHEFAGGGSDGQFPYGDLTISGSTLYGMTYGGGDADLGTIFSIATNGSGFTLLHEFAGGGSDGKRPLHSNLIISGSTLYGTTYNGGDADLGTIFSIATNGSGFTLLHEYEGNSDGSLPDGGLILSGSTLYGMTNSGGNNSRGVIYSIDTNGANFYSLHLFAGGVSDGQYPQSNLILSGSTFYGTTSRGGDNNVGTVFSFPLDVTAPTISITALSPDPTWDRTPTFTGTATDSENIIGAVKYQIDGTSGSWTDCNATNSPFDSDSEAYTCAITTVADGTHTIYVRATDNYANTTAELNYAQDTFTVDTTPPSISLDVLIPDPTTDQTPTFTGSTTDIGAVQEVAFAMDVVDPDPLSLLHEFTEDSDDGGEPYGSLIKSGNVLYGMTAYGGDDGAGTIFKINADGTGFTLLHEFADSSSDGSYPEGSLILSGSTLYGMTAEGGVDGSGTIFSIATNGSGFTLLHEFVGGGSDGQYPYGDLTISGSTLYGMTYGGGDDDAGTIFSIATNGSGFTLLHEFADSASDGGYPDHSSLIISGSTLYGMTNYGGDDGAGTIFKINADGTGFTLLHEFADGSDDGSNPMGSLTLVGSTLYGMTPYGGDDGAGTIFSIATNGTGFTLLHEFTGGENDGKRPYGSLLNLDSMLYGMTRLGGDNDAGTIFNIRTDGTGYKISHEFTDAVDDGGRPQGNLTLSGSTFYGMTNSGGNDAYGTIFSIGLPTVFTPCTADDGAFDETSEDFTCQIADSLSSGDHIIYVQATDSLGNISDSTTDTFTISISTSTSAPAQSQSTSTHSDSPSGPSLPQIAKNSGGVYSPSGDSSTDGQKVIAIISPNTMSFDAYLSSQAVNINSLPFAPEPLMSRLLSFITFKKKPQPLKTNAAIIGSIVKVKIGTSVYYQIGKIQNIWYKDYYNNSKILPTAQNKPTIIAISYTLEDIIIPGRKPTKNGVYQKYNSKNLKIIYSPDGAMWRILNTSVVDAKNQTVAVLDKPAGYYMIVGR
jgi:uncharacterized repeat protein (TIGR03803 family)